ERQAARAAGSRARRASSCALTPQARRRHQSLAPMHQGQALARLSGDADHARRAARPRDALDRARNGDVRRRAVVDRRPAHARRADAFPQQPDNHGASVMPTFRKKPVVVEAWHFDAFDDQSSRMPQPIWMHEAIDAGSVWYQGGLNPYFTIK